MSEARHPHLGSLAVLATALLLAVFPLPRTASGDVGWSIERLNRQYQQHMDRLRSIPAESGEAKAIREGLPHFESELGNRIRMEEDRRGPRWRDAYRDLSGRLPGAFIEDARSIAQKAQDTLSACRGRVEAAEQRIERLRRAGTSQASRELGEAIKSLARDRANLPGLEREVARLEEAARVEDDRLTERQAQWEAAARHVEIPAPAPAGAAPEAPAFGSVRPASSADLVGEIYLLDGGISQIPDFSALKPVGRIYTSELNVTPRRFDQGFPGISARFEWFAIEYRGVFGADPAGLYQFALTADDGARLYIDDELVVDNDGAHRAVTVNGEKHLTAGPHRIRVAYYQGPRLQLALVLECTRPNGARKVFNVRDYPVPPAAAPDAGRQAAEPPPEAAGGPGDCACLAAAQRFDVETPPRTFAINDAVKSLETQVQAMADALNGIFRNSDVHVTEALDRDKASGNWRGLVLTLMAIFGGPEPQQRFWEDAPPEPMSPQTEESPSARQKKALVFGHRAGVEWNRDVQFEPFMGRTVLADSLRVERYDRETFEKPFDAAHGLAAGAMRSIEEAIGALRNDHTEFFVACMRCGYADAAGRERKEAMARLAALQTCGEDLWCEIETFTDVSCAFSQYMAWGRHQTATGRKLSPANCEMVVRDTRQKGTRSLAELRRLLGAMQEAARDCARQRLYIRDHCETWHDRK